MKNKKLFLALLLCCYTYVQSMDPESSDLTLRRRTTAGDPEANLTELLSYDVEGGKIKMTFEPSDDHELTLPEKFSRLNWKAMYSAVLALEIGIVVTGQLIDDYIFYSTPKP